MLGGVPREAADRMYRATGGNPLALTELARETSTLATVQRCAVPRACKGYAGICSSRCGPGPVCRRLLVLVAADDADLPTLERAANACDLDIGGLAAAEAVGLIRVVRRHVEFRHPLARAAIYGRVAAGTGATHIARSPVRFPIATPTGAHGTSRRPRSGLTRRHRRRSSRRARERASGVRTRFRAPRLSAPRDLLRR